jgi:hypothetical protein
MSVQRIIRYIIGVVIAVILLFFMLPVIRIPQSHFLPPSLVWSKADSYTHGYLVSKYYDLTNNAFNVGAKEYHINYQFSAKAPMTLGVANPGQSQVYTGTVNVDEQTFDDESLKVTGVNPPTDGYGNGELQPVPRDWFVKIKYDPTYPYINGVVKPDALAGRSIGEGSNNLSGWIIYVVLALALGYLFMMIIEHFTSKEDI